MIKNKKNGLLIKPNVEDLYGAINDLVENRNKRKKFGSELKKKVKSNFVWKLIAEDYYEFLKRKVDLWTEDKLKVGISKIG